MKTLSPFLVLSSAFLMNRRWITFFCHIWLFYLLFADVFLNLFIPSSRPPTIRLQPLTSRETVPPQFLRSIHESLCLRNLRNPLISIFRYLYIFKQKDYTIGKKQIRTLEAQNEKLLWVIFLFICKKEILWWWSFIQWDHDSTNPSFLSVWR